MPKMKTHKAGAKRYRVTASGKIMRNQAGRSHLNAKKASWRKQRLDSKTLISPANLDKITLQLPYMKHSRA